MKIALLNDTHFGCRNDSPAFIEYQNKFYNDVFFPYIRENNVNTLIHLGDVVDRRKFINHNTAHNFKQNFWNRLEENNIDTHIIIGNHDTYYKNTNSINSMQQLITTFDGVNEPFIYEKPKTVEFDGLPILFIPWICPENEEESLKTISESQSQICMGHLEVKGFEMHKGHFQEHGLEMDLFKRFEKVYSGHYHRKSDNGTIFYLGTQYEITWSDYQCPKGFHIFDTETRELTRISNPLSIHKKIIYDDKKKDYTNYDIKPYHNHFVKLIVLNKTDNEIFDKFVERLYNEITLHYLNIVEDYSDIKASVREDILEMGEDTVTFLNNYVDQLETDVSKTKLKEYLKSIYIEASDNKV